MSEFSDIITSVETRLLNSDNLKAINRILWETDWARILKSYILENPELIEYLEEWRLNELRKKLWIDYIHSTQPWFWLLDELTELKSLYETALDEIWTIDFNKSDRQKALDIFNERFSVPFSMDIDDKESVILWTHPVPKIIFTFFKDWDKSNLDTSNILSINKNELNSLDTLSQWEKRALYLLHLIFDIELRKKWLQETLFIVDDIADSFDYKNKYAIIEYLKEVSQNELFCQIILSHNFDFYRTVCDRICFWTRNNQFYVEKSNTWALTLSGEFYQKNPFQTRKKVLKPKPLHRTQYNLSDAKKFSIALIPFVRNIVEYWNDVSISGNGYDNDFKFLTHLLHIKSNTKTITFNDLKPVYLHYIWNDDFDISITWSVFDLIINLASSIWVWDHKLENKIILAIAIRLKAEEYMISEINNPTLVNAITKNQTRVLFEEFIRIWTIDTNKVKVLESVNVMTPENIHLNSFMYEPILDMWINELKSLFEKVLDL
jgi:energy-coupling factor transporter ATP-binding protein EcfA2